MSVITSHKGHNLCCNILSILDATRRFYKKGSNSSEGSRKQFISSHTNTWTSIKNSRNSSWFARLSCVKFAIKGFSFLQIGFSFFSFQHSMDDLWVLLTHYTLCFAWNPSIISTIDFHPNTKNKWWFVEIASNEQFLAEKNFLSVVPEEFLEAIKKR